MLLCASARGLVGRKLVFADLKVKHSLGLLFRPKGSSLGQFGDLTRLLCKSKNDKSNNNMKITSKGKSPFRRSCESASVCYPIRK